jgi:hypothetical protein
MTGHDGIRMRERMESTWRNDQSGVLFVVILRSPSIAGEEKGTVVEHGMVNENTKRYE